MKCAKCGKEIYGGYSIGVNECLCWECSSHSVYSLYAAGIIPYKTATAPADGVPGYINVAALMGTTYSELSDDMLTVATTDKQYVRRETPADRKFQRVDDDGNPETISHGGKTFFKVGEGNYWEVHPYCIDEGGEWTDGECLAIIDWFLSGPDIWRRRHEDSIYPHVEHFTRLFREYNNI